MSASQFSSWPDFSKEEATAVHDVLLSNRVNYWTGTQCREFEKAFAAWVGTEFAVALANGTLALDLALKALEIGPGDEVIVTSRTFIASVSCIVLAGATPVFADVDRDSQDITADSIRAVLTARTKAIICVHLAGMPCEMDPIMALAHEHALYVIEDCAQAHGARYKGRMVGSIGHIGAWSFCQDKIMTTGGEGGMVTTNGRTLWSKMWSFKDHGKSWEAVYESQHPSGFRWVHDSFGSNWRMLEMQAVLGCLQLRKVEQWITQRQFHAAQLAAVCRRHRVVRVPPIPEHLRHACYRFYVFVETDHLAGGWTRDAIVQEIATRGTPCQPGTCSEVYLERAFEHTPFRPPHRLAVAKELGETSIMFLVHPSLTAANMEKAMSDIDTVLDMAGQK
jgi:dTDP-4-amino-4,6-dideoxygalactose transaminase